MLSELDIFCVRLLHVCSFYSTGQYQSLQVWDELTVWLSRFFISIINSYTGVYGV